MIVDLLLVLAAIFCAFQVMRARRLIFSTLWLALTSALVAILLYTLGAPEVAVIELSVGAGLVTVLFVFAFSIVGEDTLDELTIVPRPLVWGLILAAVILLSLFVFPMGESSRPIFEIPFSRMLWQHRGLDVIAQIILIFSGVLGLLGLLSDVKPAVEKRQVAMSAPAQPAVETPVAAAVVPPAGDGHGNGDKPEGQAPAIEAPLVEEVHS